MADVLRRKPVECFDRQMRAGLLAVDAIRFVSMRELLIRCQADSQHLFVSRDLIGALHQRDPNGARPDYKVPQNRLAARAIGTSYRDSEIPHPELLRSYAETPLVPFRFCPARFLRSPIRESGKAI